jgi:hypothetical protein
MVFVKALLQLLPTHFLGKEKDYDYYVGKNLP